MPIKMTSQGAERRSWTVDIGLKSFGHAKTLPKGLCVIIAAVWLARQLLCPTLAGRLS